MQSETRPIVIVSVRELVEFVCRTGDLGGEQKFVGRNRALAGTRGHQKVQQSRPPGYQKEVRVVFDLVDEVFTLRVQGRIDGVQQDGSEGLLEEIKTVQGHWKGEPDPLHWAQLRVYAFIYSQDHPLPKISLQLVYLNLLSEEQYTFVETASTQELAAFFYNTARIYADWLRERWRWRGERDASISSLPFPFLDYRSGQRSLAVTAYRAVRQGDRLFAEAPTGLGKTVAILFAALKAMGEGHTDRLFYLTARTTGNRSAEKGFADLKKAGLKAKTLTLTAKEKICQFQGQPCDVLLCPLARGYFDRRKPALRALLSHDAITRPLLEEIGREHHVCPFELSLDASMWVDAVIGDYNYALDPRVYLRRHFDENHSNAMLLIDEAHNLVDRGRDMFSAEISLSDLRSVRRETATAVPRCSRALQKVLSAIRKLGRESRSHDETANEEENSILETPPLELGLSPALPGAKELAATPSQVHRRASEAETHVFLDLPEELIPLIEKALDQAEAWLVQNEPAEFRPALLDVYFSLHAILLTAERYDRAYRTIYSLGNGGSLKLFCMDPAALLAGAFDRVKGAVLFSATLTPLTYYRDLLGGRVKDPTVRFMSPFPAQNLAVLMQDRVRTDYQSRAMTMDQVASHIRSFVQAKRGNYLVFLPSYQYLETLQERFSALAPELQVRVQQPGMNDGDRDAFLDLFQVNPAETQIGFVVMGGIFGEGIDLVGDRLIGAVVVGVGLPQLSFERDLMREHFEEKLGAGFDYAYLFPGMNRVLQAIGRVIRTETDRGAILLIDRRFAEARYLSLFPGHWQVVPARDNEQIALYLQHFWNG